MNKDYELSNLKKESRDWLEKNIIFYRMGPSTIEIETPLIDAFGQKVYCFLEQTESGLRVSDDGWLLYKLDPEQNDNDFFEAAVDVIWGSGFEFDESINEIFLDIDESQVPDAINRLAQLEVAISFLR